MMRKKIRYYMVVFLCGIGISVFLYGCGVRDEALVISVEETETAAEDTSKESSDELSEAQPESADAAQALIYVYVCGAVVNPGVVELPEGSRADDALRKAGGFAEDAAKEAVNLAAKVADGEMLYFPTIEEVQEQKLAEAVASMGLVNINTADALQLMTLPGIGEAKAQDIIDYREENGEFQTKEDLQKVPGIKENMYAKLSDKITIR